MSGLPAKIRKFFALFSRFGAGVAAGEMRSSLAPEGDAKYRADFVKHERVKRFLMKKYGYVVEKYADARPRSGAVIGSGAPIWVVWHQGEENAPDVVKLCLGSIRRHAGTHPVVVLSERNIPDYIDLPAHITDKVKSGSITLTHFSDILRFKLLETHGGIYLDSTTFVSGDEAFCFDEMPLYSCRTGLRPELDVAKGLWVSYIFAAAKGEVLPAFMSEMFSEYWAREDRLVTYLLVDCLIALAYENIQAVREEIDALPPGNSAIYALAENANAPYSDELYAGVLSCPFHKMSYKLPLSGKTGSGAQTIYGRLLEDVGRGRL